ncbi:NXPE family member 4-like [Protopterus annectens]|uniref:NXPE family member 4-like n=1 Tax=Protopterus annectens TaxID=7888 RepID=UPI001CFB3890|nr:NXPE family member 4-like [Protopterus annectens]
MCDSCKDIHSGYKSRTEADEILKEIDQIYKFLIPPDFPHHVHLFNKSTNAKNSKYYIVNPSGVYRTGDMLHVYVETYDYLGQKRTVGGDFFRVRIFNNDLNAGATGMVTDFKNGSYLMTFPLYWEGKIFISIKLIHSCEDISILSKLREKYPRKIDYLGYFFDKKFHETAVCRYNLSSSGPLCDFYDKNSGVEWMCEKPRTLGCENFRYLETQYHKNYLLNSEEEKFLDRRNIGIKLTPEGPSSIMVQKGNPNIRVSKCQREPLRRLNSSGFVLNRTWVSSICQGKIFTVPDRATQCMKGKKIFLIGDSTIRQWFEYFVKYMPTLKKVNVGQHLWYSKHLAVDFTNDIFLQWTSHGLPWQSPGPIVPFELPSAAGQINNIYGGQEFVIVICAGAHFTPYPLRLYLATLITIRNALRKLLGRNPETTVVLKTTNNRHPDENVGFYSDWLAYEINRAFMAVFSGMNVGLVDAWDITVAYNSWILHPEELVVRNEIDLFLSFVCPHM